MHLRTAFFFTTKTIFGIGWDKYIYTHHSFLLLALPKSLKTDLAIHKTLRKHPRIDTCEGSTALHNKFELLLAASFLISLMFYKVEISDCRVRLVITCGPSSNCEKDKVGSG